MEQDDPTRVRPGSASQCVIRLVGAVLVEINDKMIAAERRYISAASVVELTDHNVEFSVARISSGLRGRIAMTYVELHLHSNLSLLEGASHPHELIAQGAALGYNALALTDHDNLYGAMTWGQTRHRLGVRPISGVELTVGGQDVRHHLTLLARNRTGYASLCRMVSCARGLLLSEQADRDQRRKDPWFPIEDLAQHAAGLCLTGCPRGMVPALVEAQQLDEARAVLNRLGDWFGRDHVFVELQNNLRPLDRPRNRSLVELARECGIPVVATGNAHYHVRERHRLRGGVPLAIRWDRGKEFLSPRL